MLVRRALTPLLLLALAYAAAPYVAVWRLSYAMRQGDTAALALLVDWGSVRAGLKDDIAEGLVGPGYAERDVSARPIGMDTLPPFGASFMAGIAGSIVDHDVTPEHLVAVLRQLPPVEVDPRPMSPAGVRHAFFDSLTSFVLEVRCPGQDEDDEPLRLRLAISDGSWKIVRAWIPQDLIDESNSRT